MNDPPPSNGGIAGVGGAGVVDKLTFSRPATDMIFAVASLGNAVDVNLSTWEFAPVDPKPRDRRGAVTRKQWRG